jgi:ATP-dependent Clp protease ATP-binding subunit ClpB
VAISKLNRDGQEVRILSAKVDDGKCQIFRRCAGREEVVRRASDCRKLSGTFAKAQSQPRTILAMSRRRLVNSPKRGRTKLDSQQSCHLDPALRSSESQEFEDALRKRIVAQEEGVRAVVALHQLYCAGMCPAGRPIGNLLFLGPTGSGKTRIVEAAAEILFGDSRAVIKVDCAEFQHSHEIAKLIGSPPGYLGHRETRAVISQEGLAKYHTEKLKLSFLLFDEIEKASDSLWQLLLGMLDKATLTLGDNCRVDLSHTVIFLTSNLGGREITELMTGGIGFVQPKDTPAESLDEKVGRSALEAARRKFSPEFMNRLDKVVVFHPLRQAQLEQILEIELGLVQRRVLETARIKFLFCVMPAARAFLLRAGTDFKYGARHLKRAIEREIVYPLANLLATGQVLLGDMVCIDWDEYEQRLVFEKERVHVVLPTLAPAASIERTRRAVANGGYSAEAPSSITATEA